MKDLSILEQGKIGSLSVKNRVMLSPMGTFLTEPGGYAGERLINYYAARAKGGTGIVMVEFTAAHPSGQPTGMLAAWDDKYLPGLTKLASTIKAAGARAGLQLAHCGRQCGSTDSGAPIVAASAIPCPVCQAPVQEMTSAQIEETIEAFGDAAVRAKKAGYDIIELHSAHGYLVHNFLSPYSNKRTDEWGGSFENRSRFACEIIKNIRNKVGDDYPLSVRISCEDIAEGGLGLDDQIEYAKLLETLGVDIIDVSIGVYGYQEYLIPPLDMPLAINAEKAKKIKAALNIPVMVVGRINDPLVAANVIDDGCADFVAIGRGLIADPDFVNKVASGEWDTIVKCIGCNQGCFGTSIMAQPLQCLRNPCVGREAEYELKPAVVKKKVVVVGGGPAGLEAATTLKLRGHDVILFEKGSRLGGQFYLAGVDPRKKEMSDAALQMGRTAARAGVEIRLQTEVTPEMLEEIKPDAVILATGSVPAVPRIPGIDKEHVVNAQQVLSGEKTVKNSVAILGGNVVGTEVADFLAENGKKVVVIEMLDSAAADLDFVRKRLLLETLDKYGVKIFTSAKCVEIKDTAVVIEKDGKPETIEGIESVIVAAGVRPYNPLAEALDKSGIEHYVIGDAQKTAKIINAIQAAAEIARKI